MGRSSPKNVSSNPKAFWSRVSLQTDGCWLWTGTMTGNGYGTVKWDGQQCPAHRVAYFLKHGKIALVVGFRTPGKAKEYKQFVLHSCDARACCNPKHLYLGTMRTNTLEAYQKGRNRQPQGSEHSRSILPPGSATKIRRAFKAGIRTNALASEYRVHPMVISLIVHNKTYRNEL